MNKNKTIYHLAMLNDYLINSDEKRNTFKEERIALKTAIGLIRSQFKKKKTRRINQYDISFGKTRYLFITNSFKKALKDFIKETGLKKPKRFKEEGLPIDMKAYRVEDSKGNSHIIYIEQM